MTPATGNRGLAARAIRRPRAALFVALLVCLFVAQTASAFTPATFPAASVGTQPNVTVSVSHGAGDPSGLATPKQGDTYQYRAVFAFTNMTEAGVTNKVTLTVNADPNAPWTSIPVPGDFTGAGTPTLTNCSTTSCTATFSSVSANGTVTFTKNATVLASTGNGVPIVGTANAKIDTTPTVTLAPVTTTFVGDNGGSKDCSGTFTFAQTLSSGGAWLMDIHFADGNGQGKVRLDTNAQLYAHNSNPTGNKNTIKVVDGAGADITGAVFAKMTYLSPDPTKPYYPGDAIQTQYPNARWLDSVNWKYDPSTYTGDTWLPAGSTVTVTRHVTNANCAPGGFTTDWSTDRPFGMSLEIARPLTSTTGFGYDEFATPGYQPPATCVNNLFISDTTSTLSKWDGASTSNVATAGVVTHAVAATDKYPELIFYVGRPSGANQFLYFRNTNPASTTATTTTLSTSLMGNVDALAFDPQGNLWAGYGARLYYLTAAQVKTAVQSPNTTQTWNQGAVLTGGVNWIADFAFDGAGNLWIVQLSSPDVSIFKVPTTSLMSSGASVPTGTGMSTGVAFNKNRAYVRGLAFVGNTLYLGQARTSANGNTSSARQFYTINQTTGAATWTAGPGFNVPNLTDFASCSFPTGSTPPTGPAYNWQKSVINPDGSVAPAGTTGVTHTLNPDGSITVRYLVTVRNTGTTAGIHPNIVDNVRVPSGFTVTGISTSATTTAPPRWTGNTGTFTIVGQSLDPTTGAGTSVTYLVTVQAKADPAALTPTQWTQAATCNTTGAGTPTAGGFFNTAVYQTSDGDGDANNDACVPITPLGKAKLALIKKIVDGAGNEITPISDHSKYFTLVAGGPTNVTGSSPTSGAVAVDKDVLPGTYTLAEQGNDGGTTSGTYTPGDWTCVRRPGGTAFTVTNRQITLIDGDNVACTITNTRNPLVYVVKNATTPVAGNSHIGTQVKPNPDGTFTANYTITVTNRSNFVADTGPINDYFTVPAGLVWDGTKTASIAYVPGATGATLVPSPVPATATQTQLRDGVNLARSIQNIPAGASVSFTISVPLKVDLTLAAGQTQSNYALNAGNLETCVDSTSGAGNKYTDATKGIPNTVNLTGEDLTYNDIPIRDNVACMPVKANLLWKVNKAAAQTTNPDGTVAGWAPAGTTGGMVTVAPDGSVTVNYKVTVTNDGDLTARHPVIGDTLTLPPGFTTTSLVLAYANGNPVPGVTATLNNAATPATATFTIPQGNTDVAPGASVEYLVILKGRAADLTQVDWTKAGTCNTQGAGTPTDGGFFNFVTMTGDSDGPENNDACVPVQPAAKKIHVEKLGSNCEVNQPTCPISGATFAIYDTDPTGAGVLPMPNGITPNAGGTSFTSIDLQIGKTYWLVETKAPQGHLLLATPVKFTVTAAGIVLDPAQVHGTAVALKAGDTFTIQITDTTRGELPESGGAGPWANLLYGLVLVFGSAVIYKISGRKPAVRQV